MQACQRVRALEGQLYRIKLNPKVELVVQNDVDLRRDNRPVADEVTANINEMSEGNWRNIVLVERGADSSGLFFTRIQPKHPGYVPIMYPSMFPSSRGYDSDLGIGDTRGFG